VTAQDLPAVGALDEDHGEEPTEGIASALGVDGVRSIG
jgi:hypothetical protein